MTSKIMRVLEKSCIDAPVQYFDEETGSWADGYNKALEDLELLINENLSPSERHDFYDAILSGDDK